MRITKDKLFSIIKEEVEKMLEVDSIFEEDDDDKPDWLRDEEERDKKEREMRSEDPDRYYGVKGQFR
jgi:hypothetical protein